MHVSPLQILAASRLRLEQVNASLDAGTGRQADGERRGAPTIVEVELAPRLNKIGIRLNADTLQVQVKPDSVSADAASCA